MKIVLDTNVVLVSLPSNSKYAPIVDALFDSKINLVISTSIYFEYTEVLNLRARKTIANAFDDYLQTSKSVFITTPYFHWNLIKSDEDDNKFSDAYLASDADYLVTNEAHFNEVKQLSFPKINIVS